MRIPSGSAEICGRVRREQDESKIEERLFDDGSLPPPVESRKAVAALKKADEQRPQAFADRTLPFQSYPFAITARESRIGLRSWRQRMSLRTRKMLILYQVRDRILTEFRLFKDGSDLRKGDPELEKEEEPLRGFIH
jgi:hypothetical protein